MLLPHHDEAVDVDVLGPGIVPELDRTPGIVRWAGSPHPGTHNTEVYSGLLGLTDDDLEELIAAQVV
jgi:formyl-CoA transferase